MKLIPASAVIVLRNHRDRPEVLLLRRNPDLTIHGDTWVFPGGRIEPADGPPDASHKAACTCAVREAWEEAGLRLAPEKLLLMSRWVTPEGVPKRFDTWFFIGVAGEHVHVRIDGREIVDHGWLSADDALASHHNGALRLSPPGFVLLSQLATLGSLTAILKAVSEQPPPHYTPRLIPLADGGCTVYQDDAAFLGGDLDCPGPRHRLWMRASGWRYEYSPAGLNR